MNKAEEARAIALHFFSESEKAPSHMSSDAQKAVIGIFPLVRDRACKRKMGIDIPGTYFGIYRLDHESAEQIVDYLSLEGFRVKISRTYGEAIANQVGGFKEDEEWSVYGCDIHSLMHLAGHHIFAIHISWTD